MTRRGHRAGKKKPRPARGSEQQLALLDQLKELAIRTGIVIREERLHREIGYNVRGGRCVIDGREVLLLDSAASAADCIEVLLDFLHDRDLDRVYVEPQLRRLIGGRATAGEEPADDHRTAHAEPSSENRTPSAAPSA